MAADIEEMPTGTKTKGPSKLTVYPANIVPEHGDNDTGIYFPDKFVPGNTVDMIVYFHGLPTPCGGSANDKIWDFWRNKLFLLREMVDKSGKNVVLVAPRLYPPEKGKKGLRLHMDGNDFLTKVLAFIATRVKTAPFNWQGGTADTKLSIGKLILCAHSGGGTPMLFMAKEVAKVKECWGFDSMYGSPDQWVEWAAKGGKYFQFWTDQGATNTDGYGNNITTMQGLLKKGTKTCDAACAALAAQNVVIVYADKPSDASKGFAPPAAKKFTGQTSSHCQVPQTYWGDMMNSF